MHGDDIRSGKEYEMYHSTWRSTLRYPALHAHDFYEFYLFLQGEATYIIEDYARVLSPGDLIIVPPGRLHRAAFDNLDRPYERLLAYVSTDALRSIALPGFSAVEQLDHLARGRQYCQPLSPGEVDGWRQVFRDAETDGDDPARRLITRYQLFALIARLCARRPGEQSLPASGGMAAVVSYINEHFCEDVTLEQLSQRFYLTPAHLSHQFRRYAHLSVHQYITAKRMLLARVLLTQGVAPQEAGSRCGYQDYSSFYRAFVKTEGVSPRQYIDLNT